MRWKNKKIYNLSLLFIFMILILLILNNILYLFLIIVPLIYIINYKVNIKRILIFLICSSFILINFFIIKHNLLSLISNDWIIKLILAKMKNYNDRTKAIIMMLIFSQKIDGNAWDLYNDAKSLSLVYLFSVSGFQAVLIKKVISFICRKRKLLSFILSLLIIIMYGYILHYPPQIIRVILCILISKFGLKKYDTIALSGIISLFIYPDFINNFGFCLSYICTYMVVWIYSLEIKNIFLEYLFISFGCILISSFFVLKMNGNINFTSLIFGFFLIFLYSFTYIYFLLFWWIEFLIPIHNFLSLFICTVFESCSIFSISINIEYRLIFEIFFYIIIYYSIISLDNHIHII